MKAINNRRPHFTFIVLHRRSGDTFIVLCLRDKRDVFFSLFRSLGPIKRMPMPRRARSSPICTYFKFTLALILGIEMKNEVIKRANGMGRCK